METAQAKNNSGMIDQRLFVETAAYLLRETFEGSPEGQPSAYLDRGVGIFNTLSMLTAEDSSTYVHGSTIAAHTEHAKFYLDRIREFITGRTERVNWEDSWLIETVNPAEWDALRGSVAASYEDTLRCLAAVEDWNERTIGFTLGMIAHTAYHLGALRQMVKAVQAPAEI